LVDAESVATRLDRLFELLAEVVGMRNILVHGQIG
jgi:uncharacterized protein YutE (UPF0331/DUF86 family)